MKINGSFFCMLSYLDDSLIRSLSRVQRLGGILLGSTFLLKIVYNIVSLLGEVENLLTSLSITTTIMA